MIEKEMSLQRIAICFIVLLLVIILILNIKILNLVNKEESYTETLNDNCKLDGTQICHCNGIGNKKCYDLKSLNHQYNSPNFPKGI